MRKLDKKFNAVWNQINDLKTQQHQLRDMQYVPEALNKLFNTQNLLIAALVEAGILIEKEDNAKKYLQLGNKNYTIRKVK
jgi:predicted XRE-type DNA-binding protein